MKGYIRDFIAPPTGKQYITLTLNEDFRSQYDELKNSDVEISIKKFHKKRSLDANEYMWVLAEKLAEKLRITKYEVYKSHIRDVGVFTPLPIEADSVEKFSEIWSSRGKGWVVDVVDNSKLPGYKRINAYYGSSTYDTAQMSRLIDSIVEDCKEQGIETLTPQELENMKALWDSEKKRKS